MGKKWSEEGVRIIAISMDSDVKPVVKRVNDKKWTSIEHYFVDNGSSIAEFKIQGIPHVMLVNKKGEVVFKGHPA